MDNDVGSLFAFAAVFGGFILLFMLLLMAINWLCTGNPFDDGGKQ